MCKLFLSPFVCCICPPLQDSPEGAWRSAGQCVAKFDHFCPIIATAVGDCNHMMFLVRCLVTIALLAFCSPPLCVIRFCSPPLCVIASMAPCACTMVPQITACAICSTYQSCLSFHV